MDISSGVLDTLSILVSCFGQIWNFVDQIYILPSVSLLDCFVAIFVLGTIITLVFEYNGASGGDE